MAYKYEFKGTKGRWVKTPFGAKGWLILSNHILIIHVAKAKEVSSNEDSANSDAIAAVPDMLEALWKIAERLDSGQSSYIAIEALKKAGVLTEIK